MSKVRTVIFEGPNRAGKTTILNELKAISTYGSTSTIKGGPNISARAALEQAWAMLHGLRMTRSGKEKQGYEGDFDFILDRFPAPSDQVYRPIMEKQRSVDIEKHFDAIMRTLKEEFDAAFVFMMADPEVINKRFQATGPHHHVGKGPHVREINDAYARIIELWLTEVQEKYDIPIIPILNNGFKPPEEHALIIKTTLDSYYGRQEKE